MTSIKCITAAYTALPPFIIFKGTATMKDGWTPWSVDLTDCRWAVSNKGWSNETLAYGWLTLLFQRETLPMPSDPPKHCLLIINGHDSHMKANFIALCMDNAIDIAVLLPHSSH